MFWSGVTVTVRRLYPIARTASVTGPSGAESVNWPRASVTAEIAEPTTATVAPSSGSSFTALLTRPEMERC